MSYDYKPLQPPSNTSLQAQENAISPPVEQKIERHTGCSPFMITVLFTVVNILNYFDRGATAAMLKPIQEYFDVSNTLAGLLNSAFMGGFVIFSPIFAQAAHTFHPMYLMTVGLAIWSGSAVLAAFSPNFWVLLTARVLTGAGEASFATLVPCFVDDYAPPASRAKWLSLFFLAIPVGGALGFIVSGPVAKHASWRYPLLGQGAAMVPFIVCSALVPRWLTATKNPGKDHATHGNCEDGDHTSHAEIDKSFLPVLIRLLQNYVFVFTSLGYASFTFVLGGLAVWMVHYLEDEPHYVDDDEASTVFGGVSVFGGLIGTLLGGWLIDKWGGSTGQAGTVRALKMCVWFSVAALPFLAVCFLVPEMIELYALVFVAELLLWTITSPVNGALLSMVKPPDRPMSMAVNVFMIHLLGDVPSSTIIGVLKDKLGSWQLTMLLLTAYLITGVFFWMLAFMFSKRPDHSLIYESAPVAGSTDVSVPPSPSPSISNMNPNALPLLKQQSPLIDRRSDEPGAGEGSDVEEPYDQLEPS